MCTCVMYHPRTDTLHHQQVLLALRNVRYVSPRASQEGLSMSEVIRQILDEAEARNPVAIESVWSMVGIGTEHAALVDDLPVSENVDPYLVEAIERSSSRRAGSTRRRRARS